MAAGPALARGPLRARALTRWLLPPQPQPRGPPPSPPPAALPQAPPPRWLPPPPEPVSWRRLSTSSQDLPARESMDFDVVIVGAGPSGLAAAIRLKQLSSDLNVCVIEKGAEVGTHILSGNVLETRALDELLPDWKERQAPVSTLVSSDRFYLLTRKHHLRLPSPFKNDGNYVIRLKQQKWREVFVQLTLAWSGEVAGFSLSQLVRWLAARAEELGVEIFPGFAASEVLYKDSRVVGIATNNVGVRKDGSLGPNFQQGMELRVLLNWQTLIAKYDLRAKSKAEHQTYALGIKEVWEVEESKHHPGEVLHTVGYPLDNKTYGGSFIYHMDNRQVALGLITALDYKNPYMSPFQEFQASKLIEKWKQHPFIRPLLEGGQVVQYGARSLNEGGYQSVPELAFPGGALLGDAAGFLNVLKIKGTHTALKSGMLAAEFAHKAIEKGDSSAILAYTEAVKRSWIWEELRKARNFRPGFKYGLVPGMINAAIERSVLSTNPYLHRTPVRNPRTIPVDSDTRSARSSDFAGHWHIRSLVQKLAHHYLLTHLSCTHKATTLLMLSSLQFCIVPYFSNTLMSTHKSHHNVFSDMPICNNTCLIAQPKSRSKMIEYPPPDGKVTFDILTSVYRSGTNHAEDQPSHLKLKVTLTDNLLLFDGPEARYCPAKVYEYEGDDRSSAKLHINAQNCLHCKACDIKDPGQNIKWTVPEGGGGPAYTIM
eukprot:SM000078S22098  [mRNA]  locus=s78:393693:399098:+ [translate_table: standard]